MTLVLASMFLSCGLFQRFDPKMPFAEKWKLVSEWVPSDTGYLVLVDVDRFSGTRFYDDVFEKNPSKYLSSFAGFDPSSSGSIMVFSQGLIFIGGAWNEKEVTKKITGSLGDKERLESEKFKGKVIYFEPTGRSAFSFLEKYLICFGPKSDIENLITQKEAGSFVRANPPTEYPLWGRVKGWDDKTLNFSTLTFKAVPGERLAVEASAEFEDEKRASTFVEEVEGFKAIKSIQSMDEPWLADLISSIAVKRDGKNVSLRTEIDTQTAKRLLRKGGR